MHNATLLARMRAEGIDPALFSPEELELVEQAIRTGGLPLPTLPSCPIPHPTDLSIPVGQIARAAQTCLDAVTPRSPIMQDALQKAVIVAASDLGQAYSGFREDIFRLLRENEAKRDALLSAIHTCAQQERQLICMHAAARITHREEDTLITVLNRYEEEMQVLTAALDVLEEEMECLSALCESRIPLLLNHAAPLFDPAASDPFSAADFRAAALALRDACTKLINCKEEM